MFIKSTIESKLDEEILAALDKLETLRTDPEKFNDQVDHIAKLHKLKSEENKLGFKPPSMDTVLIVTANLTGILLMTRYERERVISSKALGFVMRLK